MERIHGLGFRYSQQARRVHAYSYIAVGF